VGLFWWSRGLFWWSRRLFWWNKGLFWWNRFFFWWNRGLLGWNISIFGVIQVLVDLLWGSLGEYRAHGGRVQGGEDPWDALSLEVTFCKRAL